MLVVGDAGKGRSLALLTDSAWHWGFLSAGEGDDGRAFQRFWENAIRWLVRDPALTLLRLELDRIEYRRSQPPSVRIRAMHPDYSPAQKVDIAVEVRAAEGDPQAQAAQAPGGDDQPGRRGARRPRDAGARRLPASSGARRWTGAPSPRTRPSSCAPRGASWRTSHFATSVLREIADVSGGSYHLEDLGDVSIARAARGAGRPAALGRALVEPALLALGMLLLTAEWYLRRRAGHS